MPVVCTQRRRVRHVKLAGLFITRFGIFDRATRGKVIACCPGDAADERIGREQFAVGPINREEEAVLRRVVQHLHILAIALFIGEDDRLGSRVIPAFGRGFLIVPFILASIGVERDDGREEQVVTFAVRTDAVVPRVTVAHA